jgi:hypothetical protein
MLLLMLSQPLTLANTVGKPTPLPLPNTYGKEGMHACGCEV